MNRLKKVGLKKFSHYFLKGIKNTTLLHKFIRMWEALIHLIPMSEVKDMRSQVLWAIDANFQKKTLKCHFKLNFNNIPKKI